MLSKKYNSLRSLDVHTQEEFYFQLIFENEHKVSQLFITSQKEVEVAKGNYEVKQKTVTLKLMSISDNHQSTWIGKLLDETKIDFEIINKDFEDIEGLYTEEKNT